MAKTPAEENKAVSTPENNQEKEASLESAAENPEKSPEKLVSDNRAESAKGAEEIQAVSDSAKELIDQLKPEIQASLGEENADIQEKTEQVLEEEAAKTNQILEGGDNGFGAGGSLGTLGDLLKFKDQVPVLPAENPKADKGVEVELAQEAEAEAEDLIIEEADPNEEPIPLTEVKKTGDAAPEASVVEIPDAADRPQDHLEAAVEEYGSMPKEEQAKLSQDELDEWTDAQNELLRREKAGGPEIKEQPTVDLDEMVAAYAAMSVAERARLSQDELDEWTDAQNELLHREKAGAIDKDRKAAPPLNELVAEAKAAMGEKGDADKEKSKEEAKEKKSVDEQRQVTRESGKKLADLHAQLKKFKGGFGGFFRTAGPEGAKKLKELEDQIAAAEGEYKENRLELVGSNVSELLAEAGRQAELMGEAVAELRGFKEKAYDVFKKGYKWLGEQNLAKIFKPKGRLANMICKAMSVRTLIGAGMVWAGGAAALPAAIIAKRGLTGIGSAMLAYDGMRGAADYKLNKATPEQIMTMNQGDLRKAVKTMEVRAAAGGFNLSDNETYKAMRLELADRLKMEVGAPAGAESGEKPPDAETIKNRMAALMASEDQRFQDAQKTEARKTFAMKTGAVALGAIIGSGAVGWAVNKSGIKEVISDAWTGDSATESALPGGVPPVTGEKLEAPFFDQQQSVLPDAEHVGVGTGVLADQEVGPPPPDAETLKLAGLAEVKKGDGFYRIIGRQLKAAPEKFGYDPNTDGDLNAWAKNTTVQIGRDNNLFTKSSDIRLRFNPDKPMSVGVQYDEASGKFSIDRDKSMEYVHREPPPKPEVPGDGPERIKTGPDFEEAPDHPNFTGYDLPSNQAEVMNQAHGWVKIGITKDSLEQLMSAKDGEAVSMATYDGNVLKVVANHETRMSAVHADDFLKANNFDDVQAAADGIAKIVKEQEPGEIMTASQVEAVGKSWLDQGVTKASLEKMAYGPSISGRMITLQTTGGHSLPVETDYYGQQAARRALKMLSAKEDLGAGPGQAVDAENPPDVGKPAGDIMHDKTVNPDGSTVETLTVEHTGMTDTTQYMKDDWVKHLNHDIKNIGLERSAAQSSVRVLAAEQGALDKLTAAGKGGSSEAEALKKSIARSVSNIKRRFGDILK